MRPASQLLIAARHRPEGPVVQIRRLGIGQRLLLRNLRRHDAARRVFVGGIPGFQPGAHLAHHQVLLAKICLGQYRGRRHVGRHCALRNNHQLRAGCRWSWKNHQRARQWVAAPSPKDSRSLNSIVQ